MIGCVVLGAGFGRRFGADKRTQSLGAQTVAEATLQRYCQAFASVRLVIREADDAKLITGAHHQRSNLQILRAPLAHLGMGHSLSAGFMDLEWRWGFVALLDMPYVQSTTLQGLIAHAQASRSNLIQPRLHNTQSAHLERLQGHPIGIHQDLFAHVRASTGDQGARRLLQQYAAEIDYFDCEDAGVIQDIDRPADLRDPGPT